MGIKSIKFYVMQIRMKRITIDDVPEEYKEQVQEALDNGEYKPTN